MKDHYQPLTAGQIHHILKQYQLGTRDRPSVWAPPDEELERIEKEGKAFVVNLIQNMNKARIIEPEHDKPKTWPVRSVNNIRLKIRPVWPMSSLSAWRSIGSLTTQRPAKTDFVGFVLFRLKIW